MYLGKCSVLATALLLLETQDRQGQSWNCSWFICHLQCPSLTVQGGNMLNPQWKVKSVLWPLTGSCSFNGKVTLPCCLLLLSPCACFLSENRSCLFSCDCSNKQNGAMEDMRTLEAFPWDKSSNIYKESENPTIFTNDSCILTGDNAF